MSDQLPPPGEPIDGALARVTPDSAPGALLLTILQRGWLRHGLPAAVLPELMTAIHAAGSSGAALRAAHSVLPALGQRDPDLVTAYAAARAAKFAAFADLLTPWLVTGAVLDVGAGDRQLLRQLARLHPAVGSWVATDVQGAPAPADAAGVVFTPQARADAVPVPSGSVTTAIATGMLHHLDPDLRGRLLADLYRALAPGARLLIIEDTHPAGAWTPVNDLDAAFEDLTPHERRDVLVWTEWWGNRLMKDRPEEPLPCTFDTIPGWHRLLADARFAVRHSEYLGLDHFGGHMATPRALLVAERR